jgi:hypothetical protein
MHANFDCRSRFTSQSISGTQRSLYYRYVITIDTRQPFTLHACSNKTSQSISGTQRSLYYRISSGEEVQRGLDPPASDPAIFAMAERASYDDSFAAALESEPLPPDVDASGAEGLPVVPPGSVSPTSSSPPAGVLQVAASSESDEHASALPSPSAQQPPTSGDGVHDPEHYETLCIAIILRLAIM